MIDLDAVGAHVCRDVNQRWQARLAVYLPGITFNKGYRVKARVIHERDQFVRGIEPKEFDLSDVLHIDVDRRPAERHVRNRIGLTIRDFETDRLIGAGGHRYGSRRCQ